MTDDERKARQREYSRQFRKKNPERVREQRLASRSSNVEKARKYARDWMRNWRKNHPEKMKEHNRRHQLKRFYGITIEEYQDILKRQGGRCAICRTNRPGSWHVDHCHKTKTVRGILCRPCNIGLGLFKDSPNILSAARKYLKVSNPRR